MTYSVREIIPTRIEGRSTKKYYLQYYLQLPCDCFDTLQYHEHSDFTILYYYSLTGISNTFSGAVS